MATTQKPVTTRLKSRSDLPPLVRETSVGIRVIAGLDETCRSLLWHEREVLRVVFGASLDVESIRLVHGVPRTLALSLPSVPLALGNTIYWPRVGLHADGLGDFGITRSGEAPFVRVLALIAQFQLVAQHDLLGATRRQLRRVQDAEIWNADWLEAAHRGTRWSSLAANSQAALVEDAFAARVHRDEELIVDGQDFTAYAQAALVEVRAGRGWR